MLGSSLHCPSTHSQNSIRPSGSSSHICCIICNFYGYHLFVFKMRLTHNLLMPLSADNRRTLFVGLRVSTASMLAIVPCTLYLVHCTLYIVPYTLYIVPCTLYLVHCTMYLVHYTLYIIPCTLYLVHYTLYIVHCTFIAGCKSSTASRLICYKSSFCAFQ